MLLLFGGVTVRFLGCAYTFSFVDALQYKEANEPDDGDEALFCQTRGKFILNNLASRFSASSSCVKWNSSI
jgi:hypothetical protein